MCGRPAVTATPPRATACHRLRLPPSLQANHFEPPTDLNSTTALSIAENQPVGTIVGEFNATDPEGGAITYSLISGDGFTMEENGTLKTSMQFDYEAGSVHTIVVQAKDEMNATVEGTFTINHIQCE